MKKLLKVFCIVLVMAVFTTVFAGCGNKTDKTNETNSTTSQTVDKGNSQTKEAPLKINYLAIHNSWQAAPQENNIIYKWLLENKNVDIQFEYVVDNHIDRMNMMTASGRFPDIVSVLTAPEHVSVVNNWGEAGYIIPVDEFVKNSPSLIRHTDPDYNKFMYMSKKDGKLYMIPGNVGNSRELMMHPIGPMWNEAWLKQVGREPATNTDELYDILKLFKQNIPNVDGKEIYPASFNVYKQWVAYAFTKSWYEASEDYKDLKFLFMNPDIEEYFVYMNKLYREGLLDPETFTHQDDQFQAKLNSGRVGFSIILHPFMDNANQALREVNTDSRYIPGPIISVPGMPAPEYLTFSNHAFNGLCISSEFAKDSRKLERLMEFLEWNTSDEGLKLTMYGPDGMFYEKNEDGLLVRKPEFEEEANKAGNVFTERTGLNYYNILRNHIVPRIADTGWMKETKAAQPLWSKGTVEEDLIFSLSGTGDNWNSLWGTMWGEYQKYEAQAVLAKSEDECRKYAKQMLKAFETNGGRAITNEKLDLLAKYLANNPK